MEKLDKIRDELANHEATEGWKWAYEKLETKSAPIGYEHGVRAGVKIGWDAAMERVKPVIDALKVFETCALDDPDLEWENLKEALAKFRNQSEE